MRAGIRLSAVLTLFNLPFIAAVAMIEEKDVRRKVLLRSLSTPWVLAPVLLGMTGMTAILAVGGPAGFAVFAALAGGLTSAGTFVTQQLLKGEKVARRVVEELRATETRKAQANLDELDRVLTTADDDPRPENALRDLRALVKAFENLDEMDRDGAGIHAAVEIRSRIAQLFEHCLHSLRQTHRLWTTAAPLTTDAAREPLLGQREQLISEVQTTIQQMSDALVQIQSLKTSGSGPAQFQRLREELDQSLEVARTVDERIDSLLRGETEESFDLDPNPEQKRGEPKG